MQAHYYNVCSIPVGSVSIIIIIINYMYMLRGRDYNESYITHLHNQARTLVGTYVFIPGWPQGDLTRYSTVITFDCRSCSLVTGVWAIELNLMVGGMRA